MSGVPPEKGNKARLGFPNDHWTKESVLEINHGGLYDLPERLSRDAIP
jgi:hypothetical protein